MANTVDYKKKRERRWGDIERRRKAVGWSREQLARAARLSVHTVNKCANRNRLQEVEDSTMYMMEEGLATREKERAQQDRASRGLS
jgi:ribosome-binding protein aMBF1 (putative translation factor)